MGNSGMSWWVATHYHPTVQSPIESTKLESLEFSSKRQQYTPFRQEHVPHNLRRWSIVQASRCVCSRVHGGGEKLNGGGGKGKAER